MRFLTRTRIIAVPAAIALALSLFTFTLTWQVPAVHAGSGPLDAQASEIVRLINGARVANGKAALKVDVYLASKARDGAIPCPDDASKTIAGRAQDFAAYSSLSHYLRLCDTATFTLSSRLFISDMQSWGYGAVGEIDGLNSGYGNGAYRYTIKGSRTTWQTWTYSTTGHMMGSPTSGWQSSSTHWNIIMGAYNRVGCGGWASASGAYFYDCVFAEGGPSPSGLRAARTASPFSKAAPTPAPVRPVAPAPVQTPDITAAPAVGGGGSVTSGGSSSTSVAGPALSQIADPTADPWASRGAAEPTSNVEGLVQENPTAGPAGGVAAALQVGSRNMMPPSRSSGPTSGTALQIALVAGLGGLVCLASAAFLSLRRRQRRETAL